MPSPYVAELLDAICKVSQMRCLCITLYTYLYLPVNCSTAAAAAGASGADELVEVAGGAVEGAEAGAAAGGVGAAGGCGPVGAGEAERDGAALAGASVPPSSV